MGTTRTFTIQGYAARNRALTLTERHDPAPASFLPMNETVAESWDRPSGASRLSWFLIAHARSAPTH